MHWRNDFLMHDHAQLCEETIMAKGQLRGNKEVKKQKQPKQPAPPAGGFAVPAKAEKTKGK
jgi:hypothetical protein